MVDQRVLRKAAIQAAIAKKNAATGASAHSNIRKVTTSKNSSSSNLSTFERPQSHSIVTAKDDRNDESDKVSRNKQSSSRERIARQKSVARSQSKQRPSSTNDNNSTADITSIFGRGDKRQKRVVYTSFSENPHDVLAIQVDENLPKPRDKDGVVLKVLASTVSYSDCMIRRGISFEAINPTGLPTTPGMDVVGNIIAVGEDVKGFKNGDRVAALVRTGGNARYVCVPASDIVEVPRSCDSAEAVCMVSTFITAYQCLRLVTSENFTLNGKRILITGGIEPVGQALIQLCARAGATEIYATAPDHRHRYLRSVLGACPLTVDPKSWLDTVKGSMDIVFDGTYHGSLESISASLVRGGILISMGMSALLNREKPGIIGAPLAACWAKLKSRIMSNSQSYEVWSSFTENRDAYKLDLEILLHLLRKKFIKPHIARRVALSEVAEAQESLEKETARGEIVCLPWKRLEK